MRPIRRTSRHGRGAVTIIELLIVVLVMSILAAAAAPAFIDSLLFHRVESAARRVKADLQLAQRTARLTSAAQSVSFTSSTYTVTGTSSFDKPGSQYTVDLSAAPYELDKVEANFAGTATVSFDGYGKPAATGTVELAVKNHECTITLDGTTGEATITSSHVRGRAP